MGAMTAEAAALFEEVEAAVLREVERTGPKGFQRDAIVKAFLGRGTGRTTLYRWVNAIVASGKPGQRLAKVVKEAAAKRAATSPDPAKAAAAEVASKLPVVVTPGEIAGTGTVNVIAKLQECIKAAEDVMRYARTPEGAIRNAGLLVKSSELLRRNLETSVRLFEAMYEISRVEAFHSELIQELSKESPELAERVLMRLGRLAERWAPSA